MTNRSSFEDGGYAERMRASRGDVPWETVELGRYEHGPEDVELGGYVHQYDGRSAPDQQLSVQMRELIAVTILSAKGEHRFAANHVRRLYRLGVTNEVIVESYVAAAPVFGRSLLVHAMEAIRRANDPANLEGKLPKGGAPSELKEFAELHQGGALQNQDSKDSFEHSETARFVARLDPRLAELAGRLHDASYLHSAPTPRCRLPAMARELIAIACLCVRAATEQASRHIERAVSLGASPRQILEAISTAIPMSGLATLDIGVDAMKRAGIE